MTKERNTKKTLWIVLGVLCVLTTVGLVIAILSVVNGNNDDRDSMVFSDEVYQDAEFLYEEGEELINSSNNIDDAMAYYDLLSQNASNDEAKNSVESIRIELLSNYGLYGTMIDYLDSLDIDRLDYSWQFTFYNYYYVAYDGNGDYKKALEYKERMEHAYKKFNESVEL